MADTFTPILNVTKFDPGSRNNTWGADFGTDVLDVIDAAIAGVGTAITTTGGSSSVTEDNSRSRVQRITGALGSAATISLPANATWWVFSNETSGAFSVTLKPTAGAGIVIPQGRRMLLIQSASQAYGYVLGNHQVIDTGGTLTAYTATSGLALAAIPDGEMFLLRLSADCGATPTLAVDGLTARTMKHADGSAIVAGDLKSASIYPAFYRSATTDYVVHGGPLRNIVPALATANAFTATQTVGLDDATNTGVSRPLIVQHSTSGTAGVGIGVGISFKVEDASGNLDEVMRLDYVSTDATNASEDGDFVVTAMVAGALTEIFRASLTGLLKRTAGYSLAGTNTNDSAATGYVGEFVESELLSGSAVNLTTSVAANITSISLTAGDWDVSGVISILPAGTTTVSAVVGAISTTSATLPTAPGKGGYYRTNATLATGGTQDFSLSVKRITIAVTTTVYLVGLAAFGVSTLGGYGYIAARRAR